MKKEIRKELENQLEMVGLERDVMNSIEKLIWKYTSKYKHITREDIESMAIEGILTALDKNTFQEMLTTYLLKYVNGTIIKNRHKEVYSISFDRKCFQIWRMYADGESVESIARKLNFTEEHVKEVINSQGIAQIDSIDRTFQTEEINTEFNYNEMISYLNSVSFSDRKLPDREGNSSYTSGFQDIYFNGMPMEEKVIYNSFVDSLPEDLQKLLEMKEAGYNNSDIAKELGVSCTTIKKKIDKLVKLAIESGFDL